MASMANHTIHLDDVLYPYFQRVAYDEHPVLAELRAETAKLGGPSAMQIAPEQGAFMSMLVQITGARRILEIGTFTGYSSLAMAFALPQDGEIIAGDVSREWTAVGRKYWDKVGLGNRIHLHIKPGAELIADLLAGGAAGSFDLMFIDADKNNYDIYYEGGLKLLKQGGLMLIDNVLWGGDVARPEKKDADTVALRALNDKIRCDGRVTFSMVPIGDGLTMARKS
jgi:predicted O-methyltransferase YrrM